MFHTTKNPGEADGTDRRVLNGHFGVPVICADRRRRFGRSIAAVLGFLVLFAILVILVSKFYLMPMLIASHHATHAHRRKMAAEALLVLCVMLTILLVGLLVSFRISRFFFPRPTETRTGTKVIDAWTEAGKRMEENKHDEQDEQDE